MIKINSSLKQNISLLALIPLAIFSVGFFLFSFKIQSLPKTPPEPQTINVSDDIPGTNLKLYRNTEFGFSFEYPKEMVYKITPEYTRWISFYTGGEQNVVNSDRITVQINNRELRDKSIDEYLRIVGAGIQNYEDIASIKPIVAETGEVGYEVTWNIILMGGTHQRSQSYPFVYFDLGQDKENIMVIHLGSVYGPSDNIKQAYETMISTLRVNN